MRTTNTVRTWILIILIVFIAGFMYVYRDRVDTYAHMALRPMQTALDGNYGQQKTHPKAKPHKGNSHKQSHEKNAQKHK